MTASSREQRSDKPDARSNGAHAATPPAPAPPDEHRVPVRALQRLARRPAPPALLEHCEMCGAPLPPAHRHMLDRNAHTLACACTACALLFAREGAAGGKYLTVPQRTLALDDFQLADAQWDDLMIPVNMAFIYVNSTTQRPVACYPSPAGATESQLTLASWGTFIAQNPILASLAPDVEALLINRLGKTRAYYLAPIDACYQLVGVIRSSWRGLSGGGEVWQAINEFFATLHNKAAPTARQ